MLPAFLFWMLPVPRVCRKLGRSLRTADSASPLATDGSDISCSVITLGSRLIAGSGAPVVPGAAAVGQLPQAPIELSPTTRRRRKDLVSMRLPAEGVKATENQPPDAELGKIIRLRRSPRGSFRSSSV